MKIIKFIKKVLLVTKRLLKDERLVNYSLKKGSRVYYAGGMIDPSFDDYKEWTIEDINWAYMSAACIRTVDVMKTPNYHNVRVVIAVIPIASLISADVWEVKPSIPAKYYGKKSTLPDFKHIPPPPTGRNDGYYRHQTH